MAVVVDPRELAAELALRGLRQQDLALLAGLSESAVSQAARGRPISAPTFARLAAALAAAPLIVPGAERLLAARNGTGDGCGD